MTNTGNGMMAAVGLFGVVGMVFGLAIAALFIWFYVRILHKAGYSGWWALLLFVPVVNIVMIWVFAFADWPRLTTANGGGARPATPGFSSSPRAAPRPPPASAPFAQDAPRGAAPLGGTIVGDGGRRRGAVTGSPSERPGWMLSGFDGGGRAVRLKFTIADIQRKRELVIGRDPNRCDLLLTDGSVSRVHAKLTTAGDHLEVEDLDSANGTAVDGTYLDAGRRIEIPAGVEVIFGETRLRLTQA